MKNTLVGFDTNAIKHATQDQFDSFSMVVMEKWGGQERLERLFLNNEAARHAFAETVSGRYMGAIRHFVPWIRRIVPDIHKRNLFEVGCGKGPNTAAFATICRQIDGFDLDSDAVEFANLRFQSFGLKNATATALSFSEILDRLKSRDDIDGLVLFAVLEHMTVQERLSILEIGWSQLKDNGILIVAETPNRLSYFDTHTFALPFINMLPEELATRWSHHTARKHIIDELTTGAEGDLAAQSARLTRMGYSGPSFHEFELAIGNCRKYVISDAGDPEISGFNEPYKLEYHLLLQYLALKCPTIHPVFAMPGLNFIMQKSE